MKRLILNSAGIMISFSLLTLACKKNESTNESNSFTDPRDGTTYKTVKIGNNIWMAENLKYLPKMVALQWYTHDNPFYAIGNYKESSEAEARATGYFNSYGVSYNWKAAQTACPPGWHIPSPEEWTELVNFCGGWDIAGAKLKDNDKTFWINNTTESENSFGFKVLPGGSGPLIQDTGYRACFWNSKDTSENGQIVIGIVFENEKNNVSKYYSLDRKQQGTLSIRCIKD